MFLKRHSLALLAAALFVIPAFARETVCLATGFCLTAESHTQRGAVCVLKTGNGTMEFPVEQISGIEVVAEPEGEMPIVQRTATSAASFNELLTQAAIRQGLDPEFVRSVARIESNLRQDAVSNKGAIGLMQLMPGTAAVLGVDARDAADNVLGGAKFLRALLLRYDGNAALALAAYNAGPGKVEKYKGIPPYYETRRYILKVLAEYKKQQDASKSKLALTAANRPNATN